MTEETEFEINATATLHAPPGIPLTSITVKVDVTPPEGTVTILGEGQDGKVKPVQVPGSTEKLELPFAKPEVKISYGKGVTDAKIATLGWKDPRG